MELPLVAVSLVYREGYFHQVLDARGSQTEVPFVWHPEEVVELLPQRVTVPIEGRQVQIAVWRYVVQGVTGGKIDVYLLDTDVPENTPGDRALTSRLYGGDQRYRLCQEALLGLGGVELLHELGHDGNLVHHMNEGHSALLALGLLEREINNGGAAAVTDASVAAVRGKCVFTTHTPVAAGHDKFPWSLVRQVLGDARAETLCAAGCCENDTLNMTALALRFSHYANGVALRHEEVSQIMFPAYQIRAITNGVHGVTWTSDPFAQLFDKHIPEWRVDNEYLRYALSIPLKEIQEAHAQAKQAMLAEITRRTGRYFNDTILTLGFARRATPYKRAGLLFADLERLKSIARSVGPMQIIYAGKAHPADEPGKDIIREIYRAAEQLGDTVPVVYIPDYDMDLAKYLVSGVDIWLNTPQKPHEASGTSGMKAALNGVPSFSVRDGWWVEGHIEGVTGWSIDDFGDTSDSVAQESTFLYRKLERLIVPLFYNKPVAFSRVMRSAIALNGSFFNAQRMASQYRNSAYGKGAAGRVG
jgi:starch phosphorylase